ncbi:MAG: hypothetical protein IPQ24_06160 [Anaeromyxobacter sp.]|nr:hypothetical protein [Anaeromyxobacter sp.]
MLRPSIRRAAVLLGAALAQLLPVAAAALEPARSVPQYAAAVFGASHGLPGLSVTSIVPSRTGHLWVGTQSGFARFDGVRFEPFDSRRQAAMDDDLLAQPGLVEDAAGDLWIATSAGDLLRLRAGDTAVERVVLNTGSTASGLWAAGGATWLITEREVIEVRGGVARTLVHAANGLGGSAAGVVEDGRGRIWVGLRRRLLLVEGDQLVPAPAPVAALLAGGVLGALATARDGGLWMSGPGWLAKVSAEGDVLARWESGALREAPPLFLHEDRHGLVWMASPGGLVRLRGGRVEGPFGTGHGLPGDDVAALAEDAEGNLWLSVTGVGLVRLRSGAVATFGRLEGLPAEVVTAVAEGAGGEIWAGTTLGLASLSGEAVTSVLRDGRSVFALATTPDGGLWTAGASTLSRRRAGRLEWSMAVPSPAFALLPEADGTLWVGLLDGLSLLKGRTLTRVGAAAGPLATTRVNALLAGPDGTRWALGERTGPCRFDAGRWVAAGAGVPGGPPRGTLFTALLPDPDGTLWVGTANAGLWRLRAGAWTHFGIRQGLLESAVHSVVDDRAGRLWLTGDEGMRRVDRRDLEAVGSGRQAALSPIAYGLADGLRSLECAAGAGTPALLASDGRLWIATARGLSVLDTRRERAELPPPPGRVERVTVDGVRLVPAAGVLEVGPGVRRLELAVGAVSLGGSERLQLRYRLEGFDGGWLDAGDDRIVQYTSVAPGQYRFEVQASRDGVTWGPQSPPLSLRVRPHLWQRPWFAPTSAAALLLLVAGLAGWRFRSLKVRAQALKQAAEEAAAEVRTLRGLLPVCAWCKKVRDDAGSWEQIEAYVSRHTHAEFSHGMCPECYARHYPEDGAGPGAG